MYPLSIQALAEALSIRYPELKRSIAKALDLIERSRIWQDTDCSIVDAYLAISSDNQQTYTVLANACSCAARGICYHRVARRLIEKHDQLCAFAAQTARKEEAPAPKPPSIKQSQRRLEVHLKNLEKMRPTSAALH